MDFNKSINSVTGTEIITSAQRLVWRDRIVKIGQQDRNKRRETKLSAIVIKKVIHVSHPSCWMLFKQPETDLSKEVRARESVVS